jgi:hypothetical protein
VERARQFGDVQVLGLEAQSVFPTSRGFLPLEKKGGIVFSFLGLEIHIFGAFVQSPKQCLTQAYREQH